MATYTTEITSDKITSDNPIHQRLLKAYYLAEPYIKGDLLELGCGEGRGVELLAPKSKKYLGLDKIQEIIDRLNATYPDLRFEQAVFPPFKGLQDNSFDCVVSFQVIEHIKKDRQFLEEIYRVLRPGGQAIITTPNIKNSLSRNPWHIREYTAEELTNLAASIFDTVEMKGVTGSERLWEYHEQNRKSVQKIMRFDVLNLQYRLPASILRIPYEILNRKNRNKLQDQDNELVKSINQDDYLLSNDADSSLDLFCVMGKA
ncbi:MAG: methyltransferase domain-containing protein [Cyclobacteriaceae bacterium]